MPAQKADGSSKSVASEATGEIEALGYGAAAAAAPAESGVAAIDPGSAPVDAPTALGFDANVSPSAKNASTSGRAPWNPSRA